ncbi:GAF domain-containing protein [Epilithonimonas ginsengisoli]|uniref:GAF domain-containing protein n=1 Tax=Epilithonimonas ginsengisoli TaxID=1245592 RepID=A0ABU4JML9_9FLAO|nr:MULTISPECIES: GAF domain-containing protein [Chryseobacterium group]MBO6201723.1 GAF domain-containing protein [Chryseobacterium sp.]MBV6880492.1 GAF domain-containing protein [Epilithonimonas sp. FP105]MDW8550794.1 GAF domain-containing protein [Epilithonimonas ginsengisoli]OAH69176.1 histidine kinase [Chryseobacterium sp. FP211-J200]
MVELKKRLSVILESPQETNVKLLKVCQVLDKEISYYNWTGFYFKNGDKDELALGPYVGAVTDHVIIPFGKGICGQVAVSGETFVVPDVHAQDNYLSCSIDTKAEIVVPIFKDGENIGQIDIDSHSIDPFTKEDEELLNWLCEEVAKVL